MRDIYELAPHVMPFAPGCTEPLMIQYLREAAIKFCTRSRSWRIDKVYPLNTGAEVNVMANCNDAVIFEVESARWRQSAGDQWGRPLDPVPYGDIADDYQDGNPKFFSQKLEGTLQVSPYTPGELRVIMYLKPDQQAMELPDYLIELHPEIIAAGALGKILMLPGYDFSDANLAMFYQGQFNDACDSHFRDNKKGQQRARTRTKASFL